MTLIKNIIPEFRNEDFTAILNANPQHDLKYRTYFPSEYRPTLSFASLEGDTGAKVKAPIVALDSDVKLKGRSTDEGFKGEIPKIEVGRQKNERDFFSLQNLRHAVQLNPTNKGILTQLMDKIYDDGLFVVNSVNATLEFMSKSLLSRGHYKAAGEVKVDFGVKEVAADVDWFDARNATKVNPIAQLQALQKQALSKGFRFVRAAMDLATFNQFVSFESVIKFSASYSQNALGLAQTPSLEQLNTALQAQNLPVIDIWESYVNNEAEDGTLTAESGWELGNIHLSGVQDYGSTQYTISPEASTPLGESYKEVVDTYILVSAIGHAAPMSVLTKGTAFATPVLNSVNKRMILKTKLA